MKTSSIAVALMIASCVANLCQAQEPSEAKLQPVFVEGTSIKSAIPFRRLLSYYKRFQEIEAGRRDKIELAFFLMPKSGASPALTRVKMSVVGSQVTTPIAIAADGSLEIQFAKHEDDEYAEVYANVSLDGFNRRGFINLKPLEGRVPLASIKDALSQATRADRQTFNPFSSAKSAITLAFAGAAPGVSLVCPGRDAVVLPAKTGKYSIEFKLEDAAVSQGCELLIPERPMRVFTS
jgi:hypothetical protein